MSAIHAALLEMPERRNSVLHELIEFFRDDPGQLMEFLRRFSGTTFTCPDPKLLASLERDVAVAEELIPLDSPPPLFLVELCKAHKITYTHLKQIYLAVAHRELPPLPHNGTKKGRIKLAAELLADAPGTEKILAEMLALSPMDLREARKP